jgi:hypothetical protein
MGQDFMGRGQRVERSLIVMGILLLTGVFLSGLGLGYVIGVNASSSGSMTVVPSSKGDLLICPKQQPVKLGAKVYVV